MDALLMSSFFVMGLPAPPLVSGWASPLFAGGLVVVPAASTIGTDTAPSANSKATNTAMSLVMMPPHSEMSLRYDPSRRPGEFRRSGQRSGALVVGAVSLSWPSFVSTVVSLPPRTTRRATLLPGGVPATRRVRSIGFWIGSF